MDRGPDWRWKAFVAGFHKLGLDVSDRPRHRPNDVLVVWNRSPTLDREAKVHTANGGKVIVAENGYIGKCPKGFPMYALALDQHNGAGRWPVGEENRWHSFGIEDRPFRVSGEHILLLPQRGIGPPGVGMPKNWVADVTRRLSQITKRPVKVRPHPGQSRPKMDDDLHNCWAAVTWGSGAAIKALVAGVPVFHEMKNWIGAPAAKFGIDDIENPYLGDRMPMLHRLSWAQWSVDDIATGRPFDALLKMEDA